MQTTRCAGDELIAQLRAIAAERTSDKVFLRADGAIPYEAVVQVMGALNAGGFPQHRAGDRYRRADAGRRGN